ncbi:GPI-GlcNAc transferase complex, PIG-H component-domain-containing protein [Chaetomium sp. MPI-CAGE-AT-0009]|nr:GPI-GlcNAc transferase complex, PIG-H component-domain-containing protein [Chaetomium sp. MPI-CAGE-AT-0009]
MLTTAPHLYIRRPSPTTAEFTVTTCPPLTIPLRLLLFTIHLLRLLVVSAALLTLYTRFDPFPSTTTTTTTTTEQQQDSPLLTLLLAGDVVQFLRAALSAAQLSRAGTTLSAAAAPLPDWAVAVAAMAAVYAAARTRLHTTESVLVLRGLGIQTCTSGSGSGSGGGGVGVGGGGGWGGGSKWGWGRQTRFIPTEKIRDVLINEAFRGFEVRYYLVVVVEGEEDVVVLFPGLLPRRKIVEAVWRGIRGCLVEGGVGGKG